MSLKWRTVELKSIAEVIMGQSPKSEFYNQNGKGMPFLQGNKTFGDKYPSFELFTTSIKKVAEKDSVLMSVRAPVGDLNIAQEDICIGRGVCSIKMKNGYNEFLYYLLKANISQLINKESGTVFGSINKNDIETFEVTLPTEPKDQVKLLNILKNIDRKIENCNSINKNLVTLAKTIFRDKFIFYKGYESQMIKTDVGEIPNTFEVKSVDEISIDVVCGKTPSTKVEENYGDKMPFITIPDMHGNVFVIDTERKLSEIGIKSQIKKILPENSICVSCIATAGLVSLTSEESQTNQQINSIICKEDISPYFVYLYMKELSEYIKMLGSGGSTTLNLNKREFGKIELVIPPKEDMIEFHGQISPLFEKIKSNQYEINFLSKLRDTLLPKLMSGEIDVSKINCDL